MRRLLAAIVILWAAPAFALNPQLGKIIVTARDNSGNAISSATVLVCHQGATVNGAQSGTDPFIVTVEDLGGLVSTPTVSINNGTTTYSASVTSETTVTLTGFAGTLDLSDDDRIRSCTTAPVVLYNDAEGTETKTNGLTSSSTGLAEAWVRGGYYDILISKTGITTTLIQDYFVAAADTRLNTYPNDSAVTMMRIDAARSSVWAATDTFLAIGRAGTNEFTVDGAGGIHATAASEVTTGGFTVGAGGAAITGNSTVTGTLTVSSTLTASSGFTVSGGTVTFPAGAIEADDIATAGVHDFQAEVTNTTDDTVTNTTGVLIGTTSGDDFTYTITPFSSASVIMCTLQARPSLASGAASDAGFIRIQNTTAAATVASCTTRRQDGLTDGNANERNWMTCIGYDTGRTGAQTYQGQMAGGAAAQVIHLNGDEATARFMCVEFKKP